MTEFDSPSEQTRQPLNWPRISGTAFAIALHVVVFMTLMAPISAPHQADKADDVTLVNFIEPPKPPPPPPPPPPEPPKVLQTHIIEQPRPTPVPPPPEEPPITYNDPAPMAVQAPPPAPAAPTIETDYSGTVDVTARSLNPPKYPADEQRRGITGVVTMLLTYDVTGAVTDVVVSKSSGNRNLDRAAVQAAHRWKVNPGSRGGQKMAGQVTASLNFTL